MIAIIDYGAGNIKSVEKACEYLKAKTLVTSNADEILACDKAILPGVGAFGTAMKNLSDIGLVEPIKRFCSDNRPFLGICLGLQLLFEESEESPGVEGLSILKGKIIRFPASDEYRVPHIGWNNLKFPNKGRLFSDMEKQPFVYFVHSYYLKAKDSSIVAAACDYGVTFDAAIEYKNIFATQFHPEKSGKAGLEILNRFISL